MTPGAYPEDTLVQQTTAEYLEQELGWKSVDAYNNENFLLAMGLGMSSLWLAIFADMGASLLVTLNDMRLMRQA